jgi:hypothetical protein
MEPTPVNRRNGAPPATEAEAPTKPADPGNPNDESIDVTSDAKTVTIDIPGEESITISRQQAAELRRALDSEGVK